MFTLVMTLNVKVGHAQSVGAEGAILMEQDSGRVIFEKNAHTQAKIASITKIMTAIIAIEHGVLDEKVKVSKNAINQEGSSIYLQENESITLENLIYGLMLRSGNDSAVAIAEHIGGSEEGFVYLMNQKAEQLGMEDTQFSNPHGLDDGDKHFSTPFDMALLTRYAMKNSTYRKISSTKKHTFNRGKMKQVWNNKNKLLTEKYSFTTGGKTGFTKKSGRTLVTTATKDGMDWIVVTLNSHDDWNEHIQLYEYGAKNYKNYEIIPEGKIHYMTDDKYYINNPLIYPLKESEKEEITVQYQMFEKERYGENHHVGMAVVHLKEEAVLEEPIYLERQVKEEKNWWKKFKNFIKNMVRNG